MKFEEILVERCCPSCSGNNSKVIFSLSKNQFLHNNPTHNIEWFEKLHIPEEHRFPFVRCNSCGFVYSKFKLNDDYNFSFYNEGVIVDSSREKIFKKSKRVMQVQIWLNLLRGSEDKKILKVLDFGGGWGDFLSIAKSYGVETYGLEFDERKIEYAKSQGVALHDMQFIDQHAPYDIFMCNQVMEHLDDPKSALRHLHSLLVKNAIGFVGVPNFNENYLNENIKLIESGGIPPKEINPFGHLNYFSPKTFASMLKEAGFEIFTPERKKNQHSLTAKVKSIFKPANENPTQDSTMLYVKAI
jgi:2-polyprenyl-3-methyl-5-hydroxy-6-metoxy-1,4-benzoquinol methylase